MDGKSHTNSCPLFPGFVVHTLPPCGSHATAVILAHIHGCCPLSRHSLMSTLTLLLAYDIFHYLGPTHASLMYDILSASHTSLLRSLARCHSLISSSIYAHALPWKQYSWLHSDSISCMNFALHSPPYLLPWKALQSSPLIKLLRLLKIWHHVR